MLSAHANMSLIDLQVFRYFSNPWILKLIRGVKVDCIKEASVIVLNYKAGPGWIAIHLSKFINFLLNFCDVMSSEATM